MVSSGYFTSLSSPSLDEDNVKIKKHNYCHTILGLITDLPLCSLYKKSYKPCKKTWIIIGITGITVINFLVILTSKTWLSDLMYSCNICSKEECTDLNDKIKIYTVFIQLGAMKIKDWFAKQMYDDELEEEKKRSKDAMNRVIHDTNSVITDYQRQIKEANERVKEANERTKDAKEEAAKQLADADARTKEARAEVLKLLEMLEKINIKYPQIKTVTDLYEYNKTLDGYDD